MNSRTENIGKKIAESIIKHKQESQAQNISKSFQTEMCYLPTKTVNIFMYLCNNPCSWTRKIAHDLKISVCSVTEHTRRLLKIGLIEKSETYGKTIYFPDGMIEKTDIEIIFSLQKRNLKNIIITVYNTPGLTYSELSILLKISLASVKRNINILLKLGLFSKIKDGRLTRIYPTKKIEDLQKRYISRIHIFLNNIIKKLKIIGLMPHIETTIGQKVMINAQMRAKKITILFNMNPLTDI